MNPGRAIGVARKQFWMSAVRKRAPLFASEIVLFNVIFCFEEISSRISCIIRVGEFITSHCDAYAELFILKWFVITHVCCICDLPI